MGGVPKINALRAALLDMTTALENLVGRALVRGWPGWAHGAGRSVIRYGARCRFGLVTRQGVNLNSSLTPTQVLLTTRGLARRAVRVGLFSRTGVGVAVAGLVALAVVGAGPAQAAFPGENGRLAFTTFEGERQDVFTIEPDGSDRRNLTNHPNTDADASYSSDGSQIVFFSLRDGDSEIFKVPVNGVGVTQLTTSGGNVDPAFSPDGSRVVFTSFRDGNAEIYVMNADGSGQTRLTSEPTADTEPVFSPDGSKIAFQSFRDSGAAPGPEIYIMNADGSGQTPLTSNPISAGSNAGGNGDPDFSPDGAKIVFVSFRDNNNEIYTMNADGSNQTRLTENFVVDVEPVFSPDGSKIAFRSNRAENRVEQIYTVNAQTGGEEEQLTDEPFTKNLDDWGVASDASLDPPPPEPPAPPARRRRLRLRRRRRLCSCPRRGRR